MTSRSNVGESAALSLRPPQACGPVDEFSLLFDALTESMLLMSRRQQPTAKIKIYASDAQCATRREVRIERSLAVSGQADSVEDRACDGVRHRRPLTGRSTRR